LIIFLTGGPRERLSQLERIATAFAGLGGPVQQLVDLGITGVQSRGGGAQTLPELGIGTLHELLDLVGRGGERELTVPAPQLVTDKRQRSVSTVAATASQFGQLPGPPARAQAPATRQRGLSSTSTGRDPKNSERTSSPKVGSSRSGTDRRATGNDRR
jgi:hypothetical protein